MFKTIFSLNSGINTYIWKIGTNINCISLYNNYYLGNTNKFNLNSYLDIATSSSCSLVFFFKKKKILNKIFLNFFYSFNFIFFKKFKFIGKGYKIKKTKNKKSFKMFFGYSHKIFLIPSGLQLRKLTKYKLFIVTNNRLKEKNTTIIIQNIRKLNLFTKRGLRAIKQIVYKRPGKKSTY